MATRPSIFVSYSSKDREFVLQLAKDLQTNGFDVWVDVWKITGRSPYWSEIEDGIKSCTHFLFILSPDSIVDGCGARDELGHAKHHRKPIIIAMARQVEYDKVPIEITPGRYQIHDFTRLDYDAGLQRITEVVKSAYGAVNPTRPLQPLETKVSQRVSLKPPTLPDTPKTNTNGGNMGRIIGGIAMLLVLIVGAGLLLLLASTMGGDDEDDPDIEAVVTEEVTSGVAVTVTVSQTAITPSPNPTQTTSATQTPTTVVPTATITPSLTPTDATEAARAAAIALANEGVESNDDWTPLMEDFNEVEMVLVPAGCFTMGSDQGESDERPRHEQCFEEPFWIDRYEVTNDQFERLGGQADLPSILRDDLRPREYITFEEAQAYCELREARLPTEAEWEFAARGPDSPIYPWGDEFETDYVVNQGNSNDVSAEVGSRPDGASWVGAEDISGNVWEWTSSLWIDYPYNSEDGREDSTHSGLISIRGGAYDFGPPILTTSYRYGWNRDERTTNLGIRCARSFEVG